MRIDEIQKRLEEIKKEYGNIHVVAQDVLGNFGKDLSIEAYLSDESIRNLSGKQEVVVEIRGGFY